MKTKLIVYKANPIIEASYRLSLNEQRVILACIGQVDPRKALSEADRFELSAKDFSVIFGVSEDRSYSELQSVAKTLYHRSVTIYNPAPNIPKLKKLETRWISAIGYMPETGRIFLHFAYNILPHLSGLQGRFTKYDLQYIGKMTSIYGIRLYELLMQWKGTGSREIELVCLKRQFQIEDKYSSIKDLKKYVIEPAIKDINSHSDYQVTWAQRKTGRNVTHLTFTFGPKNSPEQAKKPKAKPTPKNQGPMLYGVPKLVIDKLARPGESYLDAATRILRDSLWP